MRTLTADGAMAQLPRLRACRACGHDLITQHDPENERCDAAAGLDGVCPCGRETLAVNGRKLTPIEWRQREEERARKAERLASLLSDLDRCEHGRHEGDVCSACRGPSHGNLFAQDRRVGTTMGARPIVVPDRGDLHDPEAWVRA